MAKARDGLRKAALISKPVLTLFQESDSGSMQNMRDQMYAFISTGITFSIIRDTSFRNINLLPCEVGLVQADGACVLATEGLTSLQEIAADSTVEDRVLTIDRKSKHVITETGQRIPYDKLVLCLGS
jgi:hypothetical protein